MKKASNQWEKEEECRHGFDRINCFTGSAKRVYDSKAYEQVNKLGKNLQKALEKLCDQHGKSSSQ